MIKEAGIQRMIRSYLAARGIESVSFPNGAILAGDHNARMRQMAALKSAGLKNGMPDLQLFNKDGRVAFVEVKSATGTLQQSQKDCHAWLIGIGHNVAVCRSVEDVTAALAEWGW